ncbi:MAG TPA: sulfite exporter TauE/SafE family protein [Bacteroidales bacterium]|nr:sulfite exporter TauE/SafE family protein [Bacteroidales bacterium]
MTTSLSLLCGTAVTLGFIHTILGPDHYLPFIVLSQAKNWSMKKTMMITFLCGIGHVSSSIILGLIGVAVGVSVSKLVSIESFRGNIAAWLFIAFGLVYMIISLRNVFRHRRHSHTHFHMDGMKHVHEHDHSLEHTHIHETDPVKTTPWILFIIFVFGPCEPLIPILMYPAAQNNIQGTVLVSALFCIVTILTMMSVVFAVRSGLSRVSLKPLERYSHVIAGAVILFSGLAIQFLGL